MDSDEDILCGGVRDDMYDPVDEVRANEVLRGLPGGRAVLGAVQVP